jgi:TusA-related sulfurtransferase
MDSTGEKEIEPHALLDFGVGAEIAGGTCAVLTPAINARLRELKSGEILEVRVADSAAREDVLSWSRLSGHAVLRMTADEQRMRFFVRKK